jgi:hypothetical protein
MKSPTLPAHLLEVHQHEAPDYKPLIDFESWRVALMNYTPDLLPEKISSMQRHDETDEVFLLLAGRCILFLGEGQEAVTRLYAVDMQPFKLYNVKRGAWHSHTFSPDARVLIVENRATTLQNSPSIQLTAAQRGEIIALTRRLWAGHDEA